MLRGTFTEYELDQKSLNNLGIQEQLLVETFLFVFYSVLVPSKIVLFSWQGMVCTADPLPITVGERVVKFS